METYVTDQQPLTLFGQKIPYESDESDGSGRFFTLQYLGSGSYLGTILLGICVETTPDQLRHPKLDAPLLCALPSGT